MFVLRAAGEAFVAGTDISQFTAFATADDGLAYERRMEQVIDRLERVSVPTIAQVQGVAAGGGCADRAGLRSARLHARGPVRRARSPARSATACRPPTARGSSISIGPARTKDLLFTGRLLDAAEAAALGLVTRMAEPHDHRRRGARPR